LPRLGDGIEYAPSMVQSTETFEFLGPEWLAAVQRIAERLVG
jgi:hypothetical protein